MTPTPPLSTAVADLDLLEVRLEEIGEIVRAGATWTGNEHIFNTKDASDIAQIDDIVSDALKIVAALARSAAPAPSAEVRNITRVERLGDQSIGITFASACACSAFARDLAAPASDIAAAPEQQQDHVAPPTSGTDSQHDASERAFDKLHGDIMNLACDPYHGWSAQEVKIYKYGHKDARHAAAELVSELASRFRAQGGNTNDDSVAAPGSATAGAAAEGDLAAKLRALSDEFEAKRQAADNPNIERIYLGARDAYADAARLAAEVSPPDGAMPERPNGALHNADAFAERLESIYDFECEAGPLRNCYEWTELRRCINALGEYFAAQPAEGSAQVASDDLKTALTVFDMGLGFALCHRDFGATREAVKKLQKDFEAIRARIAAPERSDTPAGLDAAIDRLVRAWAGSNANDYDIVQERTAARAALVEIATPTAASKALDAAPAGLSITLKPSIVCSDPGGICDVFIVSVHNPAFNGQKGYLGNSKSVMDAYSSETRDYAYSFGMQLAGVLGLALEVEDGDKQGAQGEKA